MFNSLSYEFQIEENALNGLQSLEMLNLQDNNLLSIPATALMSLPKLVALKLDYNRLTAVSPELLKLIASQLTIVGLAKNVIRELPADVFRVSSCNLITLSPRGNSTRICTTALLF